MSYKYIRSPMGPSPNVSASHKRQFSNEDDNTFLPPALSSYSIALLNDRTKASPSSSNDVSVTGIYELDFPERTRTSNLKSRLSVHFKDAEREALAQPNSKETSKEQASDTHNTSASSHHSSFQEIQSHHMSHNSFNQSSHTHTTISEDDIMEGVESPHHLASKTPATTPGSSKHSNEEPSASHSSVHTLKRIRGTRRFGKVLGPPKRASRLSDHYLKTDIEQDTVLSLVDDNNLLSKNRELELRKRIEDQKILNELQFHISRVEQDQENAEVNNVFHPKKPQERTPLLDIPVASFNSLLHDLESFRKPKIPKTRKESLPNSYQHKSGTNNSQKNAQTPAQPSAKSEEHKKKIIIINGNQYEKLELLGRGGSSKVYKVKALVNNRLYAIKKVTFDQFDEACVKGFKGEIDLLLKLKHSDRVVKLVDHAIGEGSIYLVMECGDIDLAHVFQTKLSMNNPLDLHFVKYNSIEMLKCVNAVHQAGIVHSDLKPANFLFVRGILKIIDFGIANAVPDHTANIYRESQIGTPNYMAPEALVEVNQTFPGLPISDNNGSYSQKNTWKVGKPSDVWSCGCIVYQMIYGKPPYGGYSGNQRIMAIMNPQVKIAFSNKGIGGIPVPQSAIELMQNCLARNPNERWTIDQCINSDFLKPKIVSEGFIRDLVHLAVNYGYNKRINGGGPMTSDMYDTLVDSVLKQIENLNYG
ncbi:kinase-like protein [Suhomyces tanzawaensis NRRL Y-17324]|uniref:Kinase-like protein n=1 Tax=Suhomyces tanzawaensis NRRL Y-17324 TaxID=984487 RepID=A0A1E4SFS2_9ASCO|nr:kinase-like protein [Suhomyces tanzawaensis NRRL Y-17324]ODV78357.1 kinase-like protein [Suhomyces tanzawaensis NRRL Y-17324]